MNGSTLLHEAGLLVTHGWCQGAEARDAAGVPTDVRANDACSWSLLGALQSASVADEGTRIEDIASAVGAIAELIEDPSLAAWNDDPSRTRIEVLGLLRDAEVRAVEQWFGATLVDL